MMTLKCKDMGAECGFMAKGETKEDVMKMMKEHAMEHHKDKVAGMSEEDMNKMMTDKMVMEK